MPNQHTGPSSIESRFWPKVNKTQGCWLWTGGKDRNGYGLIWSGGKRSSGRLLWAHRVSYELAYGPIPANLCVCHTCDVPACVRPVHLFLGTRLDNNRDMIAKGRYVSTFRVRPEIIPRGDAHYTKRRPELVRRGEATPTAKFTASEVIRIRQRFAAGGVSQRALAREYGVAQSSLRDIIIRKTWIHVP